MVGWLLPVIVVACCACGRDHHVFEEAIAGDLAASPGVAVLVEHGGEIVFDRAFGSSDLENETPMTTDSVFCIGSISKEFGAAAIMQLVEDGTLRLDDLLSQYLPQFPRADRIRIRDLLRHTTGIVDFEYEGTWPTTMSLPRTTDEVIATFRDLPPRFEPNTQWSYSTSNYVLLGKIIELVTHQPLAWYMKTHVFDRAGLANTRFCDPDQRIAHRAHGYSLRSGTWFPAPWSWLPEFGIGGGICSTTHDLLAWQHALEEGRVVSAASFREMSTPTPLADGTPIGYGFGLFEGEVAGHRIRAHSGGVSGFNAELTHYLDDDLRIVALVNSEDAPNPEFDLAASVLHIGTAAPVPIAPTELAKYQRTILFGPTVLAIAPHDGGLALQATFLHEPPGDWTPLVYSGDDTFETSTRWLRLHYRVEHGRVIRAELHLGEMTLYQ